MAANYHSRGKSQVSNLTARRTVHFELSNARLQL
jgi:hypothetical protein